MSPTRKRITWKTLLSNKKLFGTEMKARIVPEKIIMTHASVSGRFTRHNRFLKKHKKEIKVFADVGCSLPLGAPTTIDAKKALGKKSVVLAVDLNHNIKKEFLDRLEKQGIKPVFHSISEKPLAQECDAIRFANVSYYMTQSDRRKAIVNIWKSLREGGYLLGAVAMQSNFILKKVGKGFELVEVTKKVL